MGKMLFSLVAFIFFSLSLIGGFSGCKESVTKNSGKELSKNSNKTTTVNKNVILVFETVQNAFYIKIK